MNNRASLQLGGDNWAAKDANLLAYKTSLSEKNFLPIEFNFERGANLAATRVDENGLIEKGRENLLLQSNQFDTTWSGAASTLSGQSGYDGSSDAWLITKPSLYDNIKQVVTNSGVQTFSVYAKAGSYNWMLLHIEDAAGDCLANFDLSTGTLGTLTNGITSKIEDVGSGWYRCSATFNRNVTDVRIYPNESEGYTGTNGSIYIQDAQLEQGLVATDYIETGATTAQAGVLEDLPRINYSGSTPSLLLEPSRTNSWIHSEYLDYSFSNVFNATITQNTTETLSPEGKYNATKLEGVGTWSFRDAIVGTNTGDWTVSCYIKAVNPGSNNTFRLSAGGNNFSSNLTATSEWQRFEFTISNGGNTNNGLLRDSSGNDSDLYIYGIQVEQGSYATSYIPTYGTAATRTKDYYSNTSLSNIGSTDRCTFYCEIDLPQEREGSSYFLRFDGPTSSFAWKGNSVTSTIIQVNGTGNITSSSTITLSAGVHKLIVRWENGVGSIFIDGVKKTEQATSSTTEVFDEFRSRGSDYRHLQKSILVFPEALSDADCITLTTL